MSTFCIIQCWSCMVANLVDLDEEDPTSSSGCCKICGSSRYNIFGTTGDIEKVIFLRQLKTGEPMKSFERCWFMKYKGEIIA